MTRAVYFLSFSGFWIAIGTLADFVRNFDDVAAIGTANDHVALQAIHGRETANASVNESEIALPKSN